jgi:hypothetical protein
LGYGKQSDGTKYWVVYWFCKGRATKANYQRHRKQISSDPVTYGGDQVGGRCVVKRVTYSCKNAAATNPPTACVRLNEDGAYDKKGTDVAAAFDKNTGRCLMDNHEPKCDLDFGLNVLKSEPVTDDEKYNSCFADK